MKNFLSKYLLVIFLIPIFCYSKTLLNNKQINQLQTNFSQLEISLNGKIGVYAINTSNNMRIQYRANERFSMGCTSKVIGVAAILAQSMRNESLLQQKIIYNKSDILAWAPVTKNHVVDGMTILQLCSAAIKYSDNTAMNLILKQLGGLKVLNDFAHLIGNKSFSQDHAWPEEAYATIFSKNDTATPRDMAISLDKLTLGNVLAQSQREQLQEWLKSSVTGNNRIRAGVPKGWIIGDKTGTGFNYGITNDIAIVWPPNNSPPIIIAIYTESNKKNAIKREDIIAKATKLILIEFSKTDKRLNLI